MPTFKHPIKSYDVHGNTMINSGNYYGFDVDLRFEKMSLEDVRDLEDFLKSKGWMI